MPRFRFSSNGPAAPKTAFLAYVADRSAPTLRLDRQEPAISVVDEVLLLLHTAAEIEHALLIQYLFLAYSLPARHVRWRGKLMQIAKEEMGHLLSMQNAMIALGGPLNFEREDYPFNQFYPFPFSLSPFSIKAVARFVLAEMPHPDTVPADFYAAVMADADLSGDIQEVMRIGALFALLMEVAEELDDTRDFPPETQTMQADRLLWQADFHDLRIDRVSNKTDLIRLLREISEQGEGASTVPAAAKSHFERLSDIYNKAKLAAAEHGAESLARQVVANPTLEDEAAPGFISDPLSRQWADVANHRYRWLLFMIHHGLLVTDPASRAEIQGWALEEMRSAITPVADLLVTLPQSLDRPAGPRAAPPFQLPYTLNIPSRPGDLWRHHLALADHGVAQLEKLPPGDGLAASLLARDLARGVRLREIVRQL